VNPFQTENIFTEDKKSAVFRRIGAVLFVLAIAAFFFAYFGASYFADDNFTSKIVYVSLSIFVGCVFSAIGSIMILTPNRKLEINPETRKILLTEKLFTRSFEEFSFADVERIELISRELEDNTLYLPQIILRGGPIIEIPSDHQGSEKYQTEIFERAKTLLGK
jgi:hypothetical protein